MRSWILVPWTPWRGTRRHLMVDQADGRSTIDLAWWEVDAAALALPGQSLESLTSDLVVTTEREQMRRTWERLGHMGGWQILAETMRNSWKRRVLGTPHPSRPIRGWWPCSRSVMKGTGPSPGYLKKSRLGRVEPDGVSICGFSRADEEVEVVRGTEPTIHMRVANVGTTTWVGRPKDLDLVIARLHDPEFGVRLPSVIRRSYAPMFRPSEPSPTIAPGFAPHVRCLAHHQARRRAAACCVPDLGSGDSTEPADRDIRAPPSVASIASGFSGTSASTCDQGLATRQSMPIAG